MFYIFVKNKDKRKCICIAEDRISLVLVSFLKDFFKEEYEIEYKIDMKDIDSLIEKDKL